MTFLVCYDLFFRHIMNHLLFITILFIYLSVHHHYIMVITLLLLLFSLYHYGPLLCFLPQVFLSMAIISVLYPLYNYEMFLILIF